MIRKSIGRVCRAAAVAMAVALCPGLAVAHDRPFHANVAGNAHLTPTNDPNIVENQETGGGYATHLGEYSWATIEFADFAAVPGGVAVVGQFTMTAANGDELHGVHSTVGLFNANGDLILHGHFILVGGTGRFADATGNGALDAVASLGAGLPFEGTLSGAIDF